MRTVSLNGTNYSVPEPGDTNYDQSLTNYLVALATAFPQISNSAVQALGAEADLGALFGIKTLYVKSETVNPSATGFGRLAKSDVVAWRNNANTADLPLGINASDVLTFNGQSYISAPLGAELDFGAVAGLKALYLKSRAAVIAGAGLLRMAGGATADALAWRNNANSADLLLTVNSGDQLLFNGAVITTGASSTPNPLVAPAAASLGLEGNVADGATAVGVQLGNAAALVTAGAKILGVYSDALTTLKLYVDLGGLIWAAAGNAQLATAAANASAVLKGNRTAADTGADVVLTGQATRTAGNLLSIQNNGTEKARFDVNGILTASDQSWTNVTFQNAWVDFGVPQVSCAYFKDANGFVHLRGACKNGTASTVCFTLPVGYRPSATMTFADQDGTGTAVAVISIGSDGTVTGLSAATSKHGFDGIVFDTR